MRKINRTGLAALMVTLGLGTLILPAFAQDKASPTKQAAATGDTLEEVVVTARRTKEKLQDVPISITAISGEALAQKGVQSVYDLQNSIPSLNLNTSGTMSKAVNPGIRGVSTRSFVIQDDPSVGTYFAESVINHPWGFGDTFYDIQSVQVLKGPQGTLFGRNTTGGAILIEPNKPSFEDGFGGSAKVSLGNYNLKQFDGVLNIPLNDVAALRIANEHKKRDGYTTNVLTGGKRDGVGNDAIRIQLLLKPTRDITSNTMFDYLNENSTPSSAELVGLVGPNGGFGLFGPTNPANNAFIGLSRILAEQRARGPWNVAQIGGTNFALRTTDPLYATTQQDQASPIKCDPTSPFFVPNHYCRTNLTPRETLINRGFLNNTSIDFDGFLVKNIVSYRNMHHRSEDQSTFPWGSPLYNTSAIPGAGIVSQAAGGTADQNNIQSQIAEELQIQGKSFNRKLSWVTGLFYMREWGTEYSPAYTNSPNYSVTRGSGRNLSKGIFAQGTYAVTDKLNATVGWRGNRDTREMTDDAIAASGLGLICQTFSNGVTRDVWPNCNLTGTKSWYANTYNLALDYKLTDATMIYGVRSRGYKSGGFSLRVHRPATFAYNPEFMDNTEAGIKSDWSLLGRPIRTNLTVFNMDFKDQQLQGTVAGSNPVQTYTDNVGKSRIQGLELEFTFKPTRNLELGGFFSYNDAKYKKWQNTIGTVGGVNYGTVELSGRPFGFYSKRKAGLSATWTLPLDANGIVALRADAAFQSRWLADNSLAGNLGLPASSTNVPSVVGFTMVPQAGYGILNLRADWARAMGGPLDLAVFVTNVTDKAVLSGGAGVNGSINSSVGPPRMVGLEMSYKFGPGFKPY